VTVGSTVVDRQYGEWMYVWRQLTMGVDKRPNYDAMIGNEADMYDPDAGAQRIYTEQERAAGAARPFVRGRSLVVPLNFWFNREPGSALPLIALKGAEVYVYVDLRPLRQLYQVRLAPGSFPAGDPAYAEAATGAYIAPISTGNPAENLSSYTRDDPNATPLTLSVNPYLEANYVLLDEPERERFVLNGLDYLFDQLMRVEASGVRGTAQLDLDLRHPVRELVFFARRVDAALGNDWTNLTGAGGAPLITSVGLLLNGYQRLEQKPTSYFARVQPFQHHSGSPDPGILVYSFALDPESPQPSGSCNMSKIHSAKLQVTVAAGETVDVVVYATAHNFFRVMAGQGGVAYNL
jgi:hypothetical protein